MKIKLYLAVFTLVFSGCATVVDTNQERFTTLPQHYSQFDLKMAWKTKVTDSGTVIDGMVKNVRYFEMTGVEVWVSAIDGSGKVAGRSQHFILPNSIRENDMGSFTLTLPVKVAAGTKLEFTYRYRAPEDLDPPGFWMQSFEVMGP